MSATTSWPVRVYIEDTDAGGIVYYVNYLKFMERARTETLRALGHEHALNTLTDVQFVVRRAEVRYHRPARLDDALMVSARLVQLRRASLLFHQEVRRGDELLCAATIDVACLRHSDLRPQALPADVHASLTSLLNES